MRLARFIRENMEDILRQWEAFARAIQPAEGKMSAAALRDHAEAMLRVIAADLDAPQTERESVRKSQGKAPPSDAGTAARSHADERLKAGFTMALLVSEYRALRSAVLRLWMKSNVDDPESDTADIIRFNEAVDQALAESVENYAGLALESQDIFLGILGHDLRAPLQSLSAGAAYLMRAPDADARMIQLGARMYNSTVRMTEMLDDLLDFTRIRIGDGLKISRSPTDLAVVCAQLIDEFMAAHPGRVIRATVTGNCSGHWDGRRLGQVCQNLISNALQYSPPDSAIELSLAGTADSLVLAVHNEGMAIPQDEQQNIFDPLRRHVADKTEQSLVTRNLGLGLYIARELVVAHQGKIGLSSTQADGTTFTVVLPKS